MRLSNAVIGVLSATTSFTSAAKPKSKPDSAILLSKVRTLTLYGDKETSHRRVSSIPQLKCIGGSAKGLYDVDLMRCKNSGSEYDPEDVQWTCQASLPPEFKLGSTEVICEGYDSPDDPYVLKGSCGVEYRLVLTTEGERKYGQRADTEWLSSFKRSKGWLDKLWTFIFWAIFISESRFAKQAAYH